MSFNHINQDIVLQYSINAPRLFLSSQYGLFFVIILAISVVSSVLLITDQKKDILLENERELGELHLLLKSAARDNFVQQEVIFRNLGQQILNLNEDTESIERLIDSFLSEGPIFLAYGIADPDGNLIYVSENLRGRPLPNLAEARGCKDHPAQPRW